MACDLDVLRLEAGNRRLLLERVALVDDVDGRYQLRELSPTSVSGEPKKSLNNLSIAECRLAGSPIGLQRLRVISNHLLH